MNEAKKEMSASKLVQIGPKPEGTQKRFWRSLDEFEGAPAYQKGLKYEYPEGRVPKALTGGGGLTRRDILKLMGASAGLAGATACTKLPTEKIVPYVRQPEEFVPGIPVFFATAMPFMGVGSGMLVESHLGRPTKVEGNPGHPSSLGSMNLFGQASVLTLYDPDRSQVPSHFGRVATWEEFIAELGDHLADERSTGGTGLRILTGTISSPTLADQIQGLLKDFPRAIWHQYEPCGRDSVREGSRLAFGQYTNSVYHLEKADVILSLDSDFMFAEPGSVRYARDFASRRRMPDPGARTNRLYVAESGPSITGSLADHRLQVRSCDVEALARAIAAAVGVAGAGSSNPPAGVPADWINAVANDLKAHRGASLVVTGDIQPPAVHAVVHAMNEALGSADQTVTYTVPVEANATDETKSLKELVAAMDSGSVRTLIVMGVNPVYSAPADVPFLAAMQKVNFRVHLGIFHDETAAQCQWHIPEAHYLEAWGDVRGHDGTVSVVQPLISPLYGGKSMLEMVAILRGQTYASGHDMVRDYWQNQATAVHLPVAGNFEDFWETSLNNGTIAGTAYPARAGGAKAGAIPAAGSPAPEGMELVLRPSPSVWDGSWASNAWLQELPQPFSKLTWDNALLVNPANATQLGVKQADIVKVRVDGREIAAPVFVLPGQAANSLTLHLGYGRTVGAGSGTNVGANAYEIRTSEVPWIITGVSVVKTSETHHLVTTQNSHLIEQQGRYVDDEESEQAFDRQVVRVGTIEDFRRNPDFAQDPPEMSTRGPSLYPDYYDYRKGYQWGMSIDLNTCIGCNACVVACYAENNIAVVGKDEVDNGRDMQWIRVDTYYRGDINDPEMYNEPVTCMHCENAPCEYVCPVGATMHDDEGLNLMIYNRCVGTRYCSNNCPYKVRRFNFKLYSDWTTPSLFPLRNPDVTVRSRGVMEKCTYCVQRIRETEIIAEREERTINDGEILTACQQTCPTKAIVFGDINDLNSDVRKLKAQTRQFGLLRELNTRPRTTYLARLRNPNPEIKG